MIVVARIPPELGDNEELLTLHETVLDGTCNSLTRFLLIAVITSTVEQSIASLDRIVDLVGTGVVVNLPQAKSDCWHLKSLSHFRLPLLCSPTHLFAIIELDSRSSHFRVCSSDVVVENLETFESWLSKGIRR